ncbi:MAG: Gfo/Idh/MocA family protein [Armatimonadota bacterium]
MIAQMPTLNFAMIGYRFMGKAYSHALHDVASFFPDLPARPVKRLLCGRDADAVKAVADRWGWEAWATDWYDVVGRPDVDAVIIGTPNRTHHELCLAACAAGKHVLCEKPLAMNVTQALEMAAAAKRAGVRHGVAFNYRRVPAVTLARRMIDEGRLGRLYHFRATYLQDWLLDPQVPLTWRLQREQAGSGTLGDLLSHNIDLARFLVGEITDVVADVTTFITERPLEGRDDRGEVTVDDRAALLARFEGGAVGNLEATRFATGRKAANAFEVYGEQGSLKFDLERMNELEYYSLADRPDERGFRRILVTESSHPYLTAWWPPGHTIGWEHTFVHQIRDFILAVVEGTPFAPDFDDGAACQRVLDAAERSVASRAWTSAVGAGTASPRGFGGA